MAKTCVAICVIFANLADAVRTSQNLTETDATRGPVLVDTVETCRAAVSALLKEHQVAIDIEGVELGRAPGKISIIQAYAAGVCYLFDISILQNTAFEEGGLRELFESDEVTKIFYDVRCDCDALYHNHGVKSIKKAYDLQVLFQVLFAKRHNRLQGLKIAMSIYEKSDNDFPGERLGQLKEAGQKLFDPRLGGSYSVWDQRPLPETLIEYCAADVEYLMKMKELWAAEALDPYILEISDERIKKFVSTAVVDQGMRSYVDFMIPSAAATAAHVPLGLNVAEVSCAGRVGQVIGYKGSTIQRISSESGASCSMAGETMVIVGRPGEVEYAKHLLQGIS